MLSVLAVYNYLLMNTRCNNPVAVDSADDGYENTCAYEALKRFRLIFKAVQQHSLRVETLCGVSSTQHWAMWELSRASGLKVTELARIMSIHHSTASNLLDKLAKKDLIVRQRISQDQRVVTVLLTAKGQDLLNQVSLPPRGILQQALFDLPDTVLVPLTGQLDELIKQMQFQDEEAAMQPIGMSISRQRARKS